MFGVGSTWGQQDRVAGASTDTSVPAPALDGLRKDHKTLLPGQEQTGPPVRPVCKASQAPNNQLGYFLSRIVNDYADCAEHKTECHSSEEIRAAFEGFNNLDRDTRKKYRIISRRIYIYYMFLYFRRKKKTRRKKNWIPARGPGVRQRGKCWP